MVRSCWICWKLAVAVTVVNMSGRHWSWLVMLKIHCSRVSVALGLVGSSLFVGNDLHVPHAEHIGRGLLLHGNDICCLLSIDDCILFIDDVWSELYDWFG